MSWHIASWPTPHYHTHSQRRGVYMNETSEGAPGIFAPAAKTDIFDVQFLLTDLNYSLALEK